MSARPDQSECNAMEPSMCAAHADQSNVTRDMIERGAAALVKGGVVCHPVTGDVLYDYDWTPIEASEAVLRAVLDEEQAA